MGKKKTVTYIIVCRAAGAPGRRARGPLPRGSRPTPGHEQGRAARGRVRLWHSELGQAILEGFEGQQIQHKGNYLGIDAHCTELHGFP